MTRDEIKDLSRLRRSRADRKISGVAGGIARHFDVDPLLVRVAFVILTFFGGGGILLYGVAWVLVPEEDTGDTVIRTDDNVRNVALIITGIVAIASVVGDSFGGLDLPWPLLVAGLVLLVVFGGKQAKENRAAGLGNGTSTPPPPPGAPTYSSLPAGPGRRAPAARPAQARPPALPLHLRPRRTRRRRGGDAPGSPAWRWCRRRTRPRCSAWSA
ncbi:PspC domain-containing protein [Nocardioides sp. W3-2-3]|uniref:PspC domain-containing protein n=1 Tax=Nocardioides convexus TaxID=2712224 RepID=UPI002418512E|nr:PspC domain-containing protein [Nocardioides convexus]NHA01665.1 PspC domain-containing protein [Nocardioides convexus]